MKIGRNEPCPCGSGHKYKRCCIARPLQGVVVRPMTEGVVPHEVLAAAAGHQRREHERVARFGHVRAPISVDYAGYKHVGVGSRLYYGTGWRTFHDFLISYVAMVLGKEWGDSEIRKPVIERHPVAQWRQHLSEFQGKRAEQAAGEIYSAPATGTVMAYLALAYDLHTLEHHALLQQRLVQRLRHTRQFQGARYEAFVAASFVRAGFVLTLEDEGDRSTSHCELGAALLERRGRGRRRDHLTRRRARPVTGTTWPSA